MNAMMATMVKTVLNYAVNTVLERNTPATVPVEFVKMAATQVSVASHVTTVRET